MNEKLSIKLKCSKRWKDQLCANDWDRNKY